MKGDGTHLRLSIVVCRSNEVRDLQVQGRKIPVSHVIGRPTNANAAER